MKNTIKQELNKLIPNSDIDSIHGKYYMRFELGGEGIEDRLKRINNATERGIEIYRQLIGTDEIIIAIEEWKNDFYDLNNQNKKYLSKIIADCKLKRIKGPFETVRLQEDSKVNEIETIFEDKKECDLIIGKGRISIDQAKAIIKGIASLEMGEEPAIPQDVYFFSINKEVGFRIYDDRGCDIWANSVEILRPIYYSLNSWILDYNRPEIDVIFRDNYI